ncbi:MAG: hypothetical protein AB8U30_00915 [Rickettsiales endosymbiont of Dermacentor nuttalli]
MHNALSDFPTTNVDHISTPVISPNMNLDFHILVVKDYPPNQCLSQKILEKFGYKVHIVSSRYVQLKW